jgi:hypothetical protein
MMADAQGAFNFGVDSFGRATAKGGFYVGSAGNQIPVIDSTGHWVGQAIGGGGGGVTSIAAGTGVHVSASTGAVSVSIGQAVETNSGVTFNSLICGPIALGVPLENVGANSIGAAGSASFAGGYTGGGFSGAGVACVSNAIGGTLIGVRFQGIWLYGAPNDGVNAPTQKTFTTADGKIVTVTGGLITSITP